MSSGKCKLKQDTTTHLLKLPKSRKPTPTNANRMQNNRNSHSQLVVMQNSTSILADSLVVSYKTKHTLIKQYRNCTLWYLPRGTENLDPHKNLYKDAQIRKLLSHVRLFETPWTIQSMGFSRPEYWSGQLFPSPGDLTNLEIKPRSPILQPDSLPAEPSVKSKNTGVGSLSLLQQIFLTQKSNQGLLHCKWILYPLSYQGSPLCHKDAYVSFIHNCQNLEAIKMPFSR